MGSDSQMSVSTAYISAAVTRGPSALDIADDLPENGSHPIALATRNSLALMRTDECSSEIIKTFSAHKDRINAVKWVKCSEGNKIITGSSDTTAVIWKKDSTLNFSPWVKLVGHTCAITSVDGIFAQSNNVLYVATAASDFSIKIWKVDNNGESSCIETFNLGSGLCLTLHLFTLPSVNVTVLACALDDNKIHLYGENINNKYELCFSKLQTLIGHEDWVRGIDVVEIDDDKLMLASCSQDTHIRLWSIEKWKEVIDTGEMQIEKKHFEIADSKWSVSLEAVLSGHENWIYGVHWHFANDSKVLRLLSASLDKTLIIWEPENGSDGVWIEKVRVGEVGGSGLGFYGGKFTRDGNTIIGHGYLGSLHIWNYKKESDNWVPSVPCGGHFNEVVDLAWEPDGDYIFTTSTDQTTRIHAPWIRKDMPQTWHEIARPQVHGYDMSCLAVISRYCFVSGAEEKVIRTFEAPHNFIQNFHAICNISNDEHLKDYNHIPEGASVPSLGLSNKAVYVNEIEAPNVKDDSNAQYPDHYFVPTKLKEPPTEETLMQNTLWPEQHKLYGHGYELYALATSNDGKFIASACKATKQQHAAVIIWDAKTWLQIQSIESHNLTVAQLQFSPDNLCLLSVSRDRRWSIFRRESDSTEFFLDASTDKSNGIHSRIIWCCAWTHDSKFFATGSRDGKVVVWDKSDPSNPANASWKKFKALTPYLTLQDMSITAIAFAPDFVNKNYITAIGLESGIIQIYSIDISDNKWILSAQLDNNMAHHLTVRRLAFKPRSNSKQSEACDKNNLQLASVSNDSFVKIFNITLNF